ncbi:MAG: fumarylacetoacetate hydrolase family protein [Candidatus Omnitrophica bacterium]|nr:fumarylacetoacetate hydrolase family protein [Candidatus Omnitrophota bacterium]MCM8826312.1 fumarylacetoacetate hydrolase family protein [Candidatus Omnitrophota bacterium]
MRLVRFIYKENKRWGVADKSFVRVLLKSPFNKIKFSGERVPLNKVKLIAPAEATKIVLVGLNYRDHAKELSMPIPNEPIIFLKPTTSLIAHKENIVYPQGVERLDYEGELALVIGREGKNINEEKVKEHILGYTCLHDVTARCLQRRDIQWTRAKSFDTFCPLGPWLETDINPNNLQIRTFLNGNIKQDSNTSNFIFSINYLVSFISKIMTLLPGDIISTGTPPGVGSMEIGDRVEVELEGIGKLINRVVAYK